MLIYRSSLFSRVVVKAPGFTVSEWGDFGQAIDSPVLSILI